MQGGGRGGGSEAGGSDGGPEGWGTPRASGVCGYLEDGEGGGEQSWDGDEA